jgi:hypothetical protein
VEAKFASNGFASSLEPFRPAVRQDRWHRDAPTGPIVGHRRRRDHRERLDDQADEPSRSDPPTAKPPRLTPPSTRCCRCRPRSGRHEHGHRGQARPSSGRRSPLLAEGHLLGRGRARRRQDDARQDPGPHHRLPGGGCSSPPTCSPATSPASRLQPGRAHFEFRPGAIFANVVVGDEINRASPKTQSALLESMEEAQVTVDGTTYALPRPFIVMATQNPIEMEGTYPLPEAQRDRFMARISMGYPSPGPSSTCSTSMAGPDPLADLQPVVDAAGSRRWSGRSARARLAGGAPVHRRPRRTRPARAVPCASAPRPEPRSTSCGRGAHMPL